MNNANLRTGYRMQTKHPEDLNRDLQDMARKRGLSGLSNDRAPESPSKARGRAGAARPRSRRRLLAEEKEEGAEEGARKVKEDWGDVDEESW